MRVFHLLEIGCMRGEGISPLRNRGVEGEGISPIRNRVYEGWGYFTFEEQRG